MAATSTTKTRKKATRPPKDPNAPKKARPSYIYFTMEASGKITKANPGIKVPESSNKISALWAKMSEEERAPYKKLADQDKERYLREKEEYDKKRASEPKEDEEKEEVVVVADDANENEGEQEEEEPTSKKKRTRSGTKKPADYPKGPSSAYLHYQISVQKEVRANNPGITIGGVAKHCSLQWQTMSVEDRAPYQKKSDEDRARFVEEVKAYKELHAIEGNLPAKKPTKKRSTPVKTEKPPAKETITYDRSPALQYFIDMCKPDVQSTNPNLEMEDIEHLLIGRWHKLSDGKRANYERCVSKTTRK